MESVFLWKWFLCLMSLTISELNQPGCICFFTRFRLKGRMDHKQKLLWKGRIPQLQESHVMWSMSLYYSHPLNGLHLFTATPGYLENLELILNTHWHQKFKVSLGRILNTFKPAKNDQLLSGWPLSFPIWSFFTSLIILYFFRHISVRYTATRRDSLF